MSNHPTDLPDQPFDEAARRHHAQSLLRLSPQVRAQLVQRRHAAMRGERVHRGLGLRTGAAAFATLCALAIGLQLRPGPVAPGHVPVADASGAAIVGNGRTHTTMLDEDPEFYAWLASPDAQQVAME